ncbi:MAG: trigger factor, partial [Oscillibacter sp.]|nr:trigger factor [Oscillibacter sp.]
TFPKEYTPELAGKDAVFKVKVHEVKEKEVPEMDDEFAKDVSEFDTMKDLKADLKRQITEERQKEIDRKFEDDLMTKVAEGVKADIPDVMIEDQARRFVENFKRQISQQFSYEDYKKMSGMDEQKLLDDAKEPAERQVRMDLAVAAIIKAEKIEASDEDVEAEYADLAKQYNMDVEMVKKYLTADQIREQLVTKKAIAVVTESATAEKAAAKEAPAEEKAEKKPAAKKASAKKEAAAEKKPAAKKASAKKEAAAEKKPAAKKSAKKAEK